MHTLACTCTHKRRQLSINSLPLALGGVRMCSRRGGVQFLVNSGRNSVKILSSGFKLPWPGVVCFLAVHTLIRRLVRSYPSDVVHSVCVCADGGHLLRNMHTASSWFCQHLLSTSEGGILVNICCKSANHKT